MMNYNRLLFLLLGFSFVFYSSTVPFAYLKFKESDEKVPISFAQYDQMENIKAMVADWPTTSSQEEKIYKIIADLVEIDSVPKMVQNLLLPMIDYYLDVELTRNSRIFDADESEYGVVLRLISAAKARGFIRYVDLKNATILSTYLGINKLITRALANCCYDERCAYFTEMKEIKTLKDYAIWEKAESDFIEGAIIQKNLLISLLDLPNINNKDDWSNKHDTFEFNDQNLRTLKGLGAFLKVPPPPSIFNLGIPNKIFNFENNFIQEVDELFVVNYKEKLLKNNKISLRNNRLSDNAKALCNVKNKKIDGEYDGSLKQYTHAWEGNLLRLLAHKKRAQKPFGYAKFMIWAVSPALGAIASYQVYKFLKNSIVTVIPSLQMQFYFKNRHFDKLAFPFFLTLGAAYLLKNQKKVDEVANLLSEKTYNIFGNSILGFWNRFSPQGKIDEAIKVHNSKYPKFDFYFIYDE